MKHQALFSSKDKSKNKSVVCCNFAWRFKGYYHAQTEPEGNFHALIRLNMCRDWPKNMQTVFCHDVPHTVY